MGELLGYILIGIVLAVPVFLVVFCVLALLYMLCVGVYRLLIGE